MMCKGSNNFRNRDYATANFLFLRKKIPILCDSRPTTSVTRGNTHCFGSHWWAAKVSIFPLFVLVLGNLLLATTCAPSIGSDIAIS